MAMTVLLVPVDGHEVALGPDTVGRLGTLGVTSVAMRRDDTTMALVVEGWAFDLGVTAPDAIQALTGEDTAARTLSLVGHLSVTAGRVMSTCIPSRNAQRSEHPVEHSLDHSRNEENTVSQLITTADSSAVAACSHSMKRMLAALFGVFVVAAVAIVLVLGVSGGNAAKPAPAINTPQPPATTFTPTAGDDLNHNGLSIPSAPSTPADDPCRTRRPC
jgi:hypothetical protein